jgi:putative transposase
MPFTPSIFGSLVEPINRREFQAIVTRHDGDAYDKVFRSWQHLMVLIFAQLSTAASLRSLATGWNAHSSHHYHLGCGPLLRSTLADANQRRPVAIFVETFGLLAAQLDRETRRDGTAMLRLIDSTPVPLGKLCAWALSNGRIRGLKLHLIYDPDADVPRVLDVTDANVNDAVIGRTVVIEACATYVFDKAYCHYGWWGAIDAAGAYFVTRPKTSMRLAVVSLRQDPVVHGEGFAVLDDAEVTLASKGDSRLPIRLRRVRVLTEESRLITLLTNDHQRSALEIARFYKRRWQIELLFRWIKQHLKIRRFLGHNPNAIRLQILAAMIAYALLRIAARVHRVSFPILRFTDLVASCLFERRRPATIDKPPPVNPRCRTTGTDQNQVAFTYV